MQLDRRDAIGALMLLLAAPAGCMPTHGPLQPLTGTPLQLLEAIGDSLIPKTDTSDAIESGAVTEANNMLYKWASHETRGKLDRAMADVDNASKSAHGQNFAALSKADRHTVLAAHDKNNLHNEGNGWKALKELLLLCYYLSEDGASKELRYDLVPGVWRADIPYAEIGRSWAMH